MTDFENVDDDIEPKSESSTGVQEKKRMTYYDDIQAKTERDKERQKRILRYAGFILAATILFIVLCCEILLLCFLWTASQKNDVLPTSLIALSIAQVFSVTTITLMILFAVFRGFHSDDLDNLPIKKFERFAKAFIRLPSSGS